DNVQSADPSILETKMTELLTEAITKTHKDKNLTKILGKMAAVMSAQLQNTYQLLERTTNVLKTHNQENELLKKQTEQEHQARLHAQTRVAELETQITQLKSKNADSDNQEIHLLKTENDRLQKAISDKQNQLQTVEAELEIQKVKPKELAELEAELTEPGRDTSFPPEAQRKSLSPAFPSLPQSSLSLGNQLPQGPTDCDLDGIARKTERFEPNSDGSNNDIHPYLTDINYFLKRVPHASVDDKICLIKMTSSRDVSSFIDHQPVHVRADYEKLYTGLTAALLVRQGRSENPHQYYHRLLRAYFGSRNEPGMEEDLDFKTLFVRNLHPTTSHHIGVSACPRTLDSQQLQKLTVKGFNRLRQSQSRSSEPNTILRLDSSSSPMKLEGTSGHKSHGRITHPPQAKRPKTTPKGSSPQGPRQTHKRVKPPWTGKRQDHMRPPYAQTAVTLSTIAELTLTIGPMTLVHPVYVSTLDNTPFLMGKDLLNRFEPIIDFKRSVIWAQVRQPLPLAAPEDTVTQSYSQELTRMTGDARRTPQGPYDIFLCTVDASTPTVIHYPQSEYVTESGGTLCTSSSVLHDLQLPTEPGLPRVTDYYCCSM
uniref:Uncharacterized protein n=1 Tax=Acanthochromis polyacanthus TaxID=80966 RepID=A0A3Q1FEY8_9TELE